MELFCETSLNFWTWQHQKRSTTLPQFSKLTTPKTKQFGETSFENGKLSRADGLVPMRFVFHLSKVLGLRGKVMPGHTYIRSAAPVTQNHPNISDEHVSCTAPATRNASLQIFFKSSNVPRLPTFLKLLQNPHVLLTFGKVPNPLRLPRKITPRDGHFLSPLTSTCASRHNGVQFFNISTSKSAPWLRNLLRAATACNFSSLIWPDGSAPAALASLLFDPPEPQDIGKNAVFRDFSTFRAPASSFFWLFLFSDLLSSSLLWLFPPLLFHLSILSEVWLLNFLHNIRYIYIHIGTITISGGRGDHRHWAIYVHIYIYICAYVYIYIYIHIHTYIYIYTHTNTSGVTGEFSLPLDQHLLGQLRQGGDFLIGQWTTTDLHEDAAHGPNLRPMPTLHSPSSTSTGDFNQQ